MFKLESNISSDYNATDLTTRRVMVISPRSDVKYGMTGVIKSVDIRSTALHSGTDCEVVLENKKTKTLRMEELYLLPQTEEEFDAAISFVEQTKSELIERKEFLREVGTGFYDEGKFLARKLLKRLTDAPSEEAKQQLLLEILQQKEEK